MRKILVLNLGSTSFKFKLYNMGGEETLLASGGVESIGTEGAYRIRANGSEEKERCRCQTHIDALEWCMAVLSRMASPWTWPHWMPLATRRCMEAAYPGPGWWTTR